MASTPTMGEHRCAGIDPLVRARDILVSLRTQLARHGVSPAPELELHAVAGLISHYDFAARRIYVGMYREGDAAARLMVRYLATILGLDERRLLSLFDLLLPWSLAHELAHHLRHQAGRFGADLWHEEMVAHQLAWCFCQNLSIGDRQRLLALLHDALAVLGKRLGLTPAVYVDSYADLPLAIAGTGLIPMRAARALQAIAKEYPEAALPLLATLGGGTRQIDERLRRRTEWQAAFNDKRCSAEQQLYLHLGWVALTVSVEERGYLRQWVRAFLPEPVGGPASPHAADDAIEAVLAVTDPFRQLPLAWRRELCQCAVGIEARRGDSIANAFERSEDVFLIEGGSVDLRKASRHSQMAIGPGLACGARGLPISIRAKADLCGHVLRGVDLRVFAVRHPGAASALRQWGGSFDTVRELAQLESF